MRNEQKDYFMTRRQSSLFKAKDLEKKVDQQIDEFQKKGV